MAGITSLVAGHAAILKVCGWNPALVVHMQTTPIWLHDVAGETEAGLLGALNVLLDPPPGADSRHDEKSQEGQDFASTRDGKIRCTYAHHKDNDNGDCQ